MQIRVPLAPSPSLIPSPSRREWLGGTKPSPLTMAEHLFANALPLAGDGNSNGLTHEDDHLISVRVLRRQRLALWAAFEVFGNASGRLADGHADTLAQPTQGAVDRCRLGGMVWIQHAPHLALGNIEIAGETALRHAGLAERFVEGRFQCDRHRRDHEGPPPGRTRRLGEVSTLPHRRCNQLPQQIPGFGQRLVQGAPSVAPHPKSGNATT